MSISVSDPIIWVHEDALRGNHPVNIAAGQEALSYFIWDDEYFKSQAYSLKRLVFIYECLIEMDVKIIRGDMLEVLQAFNASIIYVADTNNTHLSAIIMRLKEMRSVHVIADEIFSLVEPNADMGRFFRFWNSGRKSMLQPNAGLNSLKKR